VFTLRMDIPLGAPTLWFTLTLVASELGENGSVVGIHSLTAELGRRWRRTLSTSELPFTGSSSVAMVWQICTEYLIETKQLKRVKCVLVECKINPHTLLAFEPVEDSWQGI
jgi:hypothetical protein